VAGSGLLSPAQEKDIASWVDNNELENDERVVGEKAIKSMREENLIFMKQVANASSADERLEALSKIVKNKKAIVDLMSYKAEVMKEKESVMVNKKTRGESLALNRRDLPKFQLSSFAVKAFPNEEVFESVDHYLRTFESILNSSSLDLEMQWAKLLPLCMPNGERAWVDKTLLKCLSWAEV
ncbi:hypothetical protein INT46_003144, partial [Mucor plumbeus]